MKRVLGLLLMGGWLMAGELVTLGGSLFNDYAKGATASYEYEYGNGITSTLEYTKLYDVEFAKGGDYKTTRSCGCPVKVKPVCPIKSSTEPAKSIPSPSKVVSAKDTVYTKDVDLIAMKVKYNMGDYLKVYSGVGYSFTDSIYKEDIFIPFGFEASYAYKKHYMVGASYGFNIDMFNISEADTVARVFIGYRL